MRGHVNHWLLDEESRVDGVLRRGCERCGARDGVRRIPAQTAYHWEPWHQRRDGARFAVVDLDLSWEEEVFLALRATEEDLNRDPDLCAECGEEYVAFWQEQWREYYSGLL